MNRGLSTVQMLQQMYNATNQQPFGSGLTAVTEVRKNKVYLLDYVFFSCTDGYIMYCYPQSLTMPPPLLLLHIVHQYTRKI